MTWFKVDDTFHAHPKVIATDPAALGLWVVAGTWSSANLTDGFIPDHVLPRLLPDSATLAAKLVTSGLWRKARGGHKFHDWKDYNPTSSEVRAIREKRAEAGRKGGLARGKGASKRLANSQANAKDVATGLLIPPTRPSSSNEEERVGDRPALRTGAVGPDPPDNPDWRTLPAVGQLSDEQRERNTLRRNELRSTHQPRHSANDPDISATGSTPMGDTT